MREVVSLGEATRHTSAGTISLPSSSASSTKSSPTKSEIIKVIDDDVEMAEDLVVEVLPQPIVVIADDNDIELMEGVSSASRIELNGFFHLQKSNLYLVKIGK